MPASKSVSKPRVSRVPVPVEKPVAGGTDPFVPSIDFSVLNEVATASAKNEREFETVVRAVRLLARKTKVFTISGAAKRKRTRAHVLGAVLPRPKSDHTADQCREMGIAVGDVIQGRESYSSGWNEARLRLVWLGEQVAVWETKRLSNTTSRWRKTGEDSAWTLDCRDWHRVDRF